MGKRGLPRTPTAILKKRGSRLPENRPDDAVFDDAMPTCPRWMRPEAKKCWKKLVPMLVATPGLLKKVDENALTRYCQTWAKWRECEEFLAKSGSVLPVKDSNGNVVDIKQFPQANLALKLDARLDAMERQFGMTPSARASLSFVAPPAKRANDPDNVIRLALGG